MKILVLTDIFPRNQDEVNGRFIYNQVIALRKYCPELEIEVLLINNILYSKTIMKNYTINFEDGEVTINVMNYFKIRHFVFHFLLVKDIYKFFARNKFDMIHVHFAFPQGYIAYILKKKYGISYILTLHGSDIHTIPFKGLNYKLKINKIINNANKLIFVNNNLISIAKQLGYKFNKYCITENGIDTKKYGDISMPEAERKTRIAKSGKIVGFIGNMELVKGVDRLPKIIKEVVRKREDIQFIIIGNGRYKQNIKESIEKMKLSNNVIMIDSVKHENIPYYYALMDIVILPSRKEGFPCVIQESFASGKPVVVSNIKSLSPYINNTVGILVSVNKNIIKCFSDAINKALEKKWDKMKIQKQADKFDWEEIIQKMRKNYESF